MLPVMSNSSSDLHTNLLPPADSESDVDEAFQKSMEEKNQFIPIPLIKLGKSRTQLLAVQGDVGHDSLQTQSSANNSKHDGAIPLKLALPSNSEKNKNYGGCSQREAKKVTPIWMLRGFHPTAKIHLNIHEFSLALGIIREELIANNIDIEVFEESTNKNLSRRVLRWLVFESFVVKILQYPFLDERGIQNAEIVSASKYFCDQIVEWLQTRVWPRATSVPFKSEDMLRRAYGVSEFFAGMEAFVNRVWSLLLLTFLGNDLYYYYTFPDERYDTTLTTIFFTQSQNEEMLSTSLTSNYVWPELLAVPIVWGLINAIYARFYVRDFNEANREATVKKLLLSFENYKSGLVYDIIVWLFPFNRINNALALMQRTLLWDNRLSPEMRLALFTALKSFVCRSSKITQLNGIATLNMLADSVASSDFLRMRRYNVDKAQLLSFLTIKTESIAELRRLAASYRLDQQPEDNFYARFIKPLMRYVMAHYALWCLGLSQSKLLQPLFCSWKLGKLYVQFRFLYTIANGIAIIVQRYLDKRACESQGKLWMYMNQVADYVCSVCGDLNVFYRNIFSMQSCLDDFMSRPQKLDEVMRLLNRIQSSDNITVLDFNGQSLGSDAICTITELFPRLQIRDLNLVYQHIRNNGTICLAQSLLRSQWQSLNLVGNQIIDIRALAQALPRSQLQNLDLSVNQIVDISALAQALPGSLLQSLYLNSNQIANISALEQALPGSQLQSLNLRGNQVVDISALAQALPGSQLQHLDLYGNQIADISALAQALPRSQLQNLDLSGNQIVDISALVQALPRSQLQSLDLSGNQIVDISALVQALPGSQLQSLNLRGNQIVNTSSLAQSLSHSSLQYLDLGSRPRTIHFLKI